MTLVLNLASIDKHLPPMKPLKLYGKSCICAYSGARFHNHYEN